MKKTFFLSVLVSIFLCFSSIFFIFHSLAFGEDLTILSDDEFLDRVEKDTFRFFWEEVNEKNGLIRDSSNKWAPSSIASVGFGLVAICVAQSRGWITYKEAYDRILTTLITFRDKVPNEHGFFYHWIDMKTAKRAWSSEVSSIDTSLFLAGALFAAEYFKGTKIERVAFSIYERVEWPWMLNKKNVLNMGWKPEEGFLPYYWDTYSELMIIYALAIGSPTYPISPETWYNWKRPVGEYKGYRLVYCSTGSLFTYQYAHAWIDFRDLDDKGINWWQNSIEAVKANRQFCIDNKDKFKTYEENVWGITASTGPDGYKGYGAKPGAGFHDGTICPAAVGGSIALMPEISIKTLKYMYKKYGKKIYGKYGFKDAFNVDRNWFSNEYLGISEGIILLMIENYRSGLVWEYFNRAQPIRKWRKLVFGK
jgi:hypothetical protein